MSSAMMAENKRGAADMRAPLATAWFRGENSAQCIKDMRSLASQVGCPNCTHVRSTCAHVSSQALAGAAYRNSARLAHRLEATSNTVRLRPSTMTEVRIGQVWEQVSKHERGMHLEVVRNTGRRWVLRPVGGGPSKKRGLREGVWTLSTEQ